MSNDNLHDQNEAGDLHAQGHDDGSVHAHISSLPFYIAIFFTLIVLTLTTVGVSYVHLGRANLAVAVVIASMKATLVVLFFMHLRYDNKFNAMILILSLLFIGIFFAYTMNDTDRRAEIDPDQGARILPTTGVPAPGGPEIPSANPSSGTPVVEAPMAAPPSGAHH
jgi:cytochrome c oxidase subunit 4